MPDDPSDWKARREARGAAVRKEMPPGVAVLAVLHVCSGLSMLVLLLYAIASFGVLASLTDPLGTPPALTIVSFLFLATITFGAGVGQIRGEQWGWWLTTFCYVYSGSMNVLAMYTVWSLNEELADSPATVPTLLAKYLFGLTIALLLLRYVIKDRVRTYFGAQQSDSRVAIAIHLGICVVLTAISLLSTGMPT